MTSSFTTWWCGIPHAITTPKHDFYNLLKIWLQWKKKIENDICDFKNNFKNEYSRIGPIIKDMFCVYVIKYLTINQHDDSYITLDKIKHLLVGHYVRDDVQSLNVALCMKTQVQKLYTHDKKSLPLNQTQKWLLFSKLYFVTT